MAKMKKDDHHKLHVTPEAMEAVIQAYSFLDSYEKVSAWMRTDNLNLGGFSPITMLNRGKGAKLLEFIHSSTPLECPRCDKEICECCPYCHRTPCLPDCEAHAEEG